jgi:hypothetical protein
VPNPILDNDDAFERRFRSKVTELLEMVLAKRRDYGSSVGFHGTRGIMPRIADKFFRLNNLVWDSHTPKYESAQDSADDLAVYALILSIGLEGDVLSELSDVVPRD